MRPVEGSGDLTLTARPATPEVFLPFGRLVRPEETTTIGDSGAVLMSLSELTPGPRRVTNLHCYPDAHRAVMALGDVTMWMVVVAPDRESPVAAFSLPADHAAVLAPGVWHAGPWPLSDTTVCELLETRDAVDRMDRRHVRDVASVDGVRVVLPEEPGARPAGLDLSDPDALRLDDFAGRLAMCVLSMEGLDQDAGRVALREECARVTDGLRALWGHAPEVTEIPGVQSAREHLADLGVVSDRAAWPDEELLRDVLQGIVPEWPTALDAVRALCFLRMRVPITFLDADRVASRLVVRAAPADAPASDDFTILPRTPVLHDGTGVVATPVAVARAHRPTAETRRVLAVLWLSPALESGALDALVNGVAAAVRTHCGGRLVGRRALA